MACSKASPHQIEVFPPCSVSVRLYNNSPGMAAELSPLTVATAWSSLRQSGVTADFTDSQLLLRFIGRVSVCVPFLFFLCACPERRITH